MGLTMHLGSIVLFVFPFSLNILLVYRMLFVIVFLCCFRVGWLGMFFMSLKVLLISRFISSIC